MTSYSQSDLIRFAGYATQDARSALRDAFCAENNAGHGFDPTGEEEGWTLPSEAETTDDVSAYSFVDEDGDTWLMLVGTDGTGSDDSRWAVRIGDAGIELDFGG